MVLFHSKTGSTYYVTGEADKWMKNSVILHKFTLHLRTDDGKLLISLKNTFAEKPVLIDGIPHSSKEGHGFGTQSIRYVTEKLNGNCQFSVKDGWFIFRIVL